MIDSLSMMLIRKENFTFFYVRKRLLLDAIAADIIEVDERIKLIARLRFPL